MKLSMALIVDILTFLSKYKYSDDIPPSHPNNIGSELLSRLKTEMSDESK